METPEDEAPVIEEPGDEPDLGDTPMKQDEPGAIVEVEWLSGSYHEIAGT